MRKATVTLIVGLVFGVAGAAQAGLIGCWAFDEGSGSTVVDSSTGGHNAGLNGRYIWSSGGTLSPLPLGPAARPREIRFPISET